MSEQEDKKSQRDVKTWDTSTQAQMAAISNLGATTPTGSEDTIVDTDKTAKPQTYVYF